MKNTLNKPVARYFGVALIATLIDWALFAILIHLKFYYLYAHFMSFGLGVIVNYILCNLWVFKMREWAHNPWMERFLFLGTALLGLGINSGALILFVFLFHQISFLQNEQAEMAAKIVATGIAFFWNYWSKKVFVYQKIK